MIADPLFADLGDFGVRPIGRARLAPAAATRPFRRPYWNSEWAHGPCIIRRAVSPEAARYRGSLWQSPRTRRLSGAKKRKCRRLISLSLTGPGKRAPRNGDRPQLSKVLKSSRDSRGRNYTDSKSRFSVIRMPRPANRSRKSRVRCLAVSSCSTVKLTLSKSTIHGAFWLHRT